MSDDPIDLGDGLMLVMVPPYEARMVRECIAKLRAQIASARAEGIAEGLRRAEKLVSALAEEIQQGADACRKTHPSHAEDRAEYADDARRVAAAILTLAAKEERG